MPRLSGSRRFRNKGESKGKQVTLIPCGTTCDVAGTKIVPETVPTDRQGSHRERFNDNAIVHLYMREINEVPLLTLDKENELAAKIKKGDAEAREHMIKANLRLVVKIARDYENYGLPLLDLVSEGNIGLMKAVERFDPAKGAKLSTYAAWWIKQAIKRALADQAKTIRLPVHVVDKLFHIRKVEAKLVELFGRTPTDAEIADEVNLKPQDVHDYRKASVSPLSLDAKTDPDNESSAFADVLPDTQAVMSDRELDQKMTGAMVRKYLKDLSPREITILELRFGLKGANEETLEVVGQKFGITRERIRQLQDEALRKLRKRMERDGVMASS